MEFSWNPKKAAKNLKDHKVAFEEAATIFGDALAITFNDPDHSVGEHRLLTFGVSSVVDSWLFRISSAFNSIGNPGWPANASTLFFVSPWAETNVPAQVRAELRG